MTTTAMSITELAALRQQLLDNFNGREVDNEKIDLPEFKKICTVETKIAKATFKTRADKRVGDKILKENAPRYWCSFQEKLFLRIQQFA